MKRFLTIIAAVATLAVVSCEKTEVEDNLNLSSSSIVVSNAGGTQNIVFSSNADWTIESDKDFITFDRKSGTAGNNLTVVMTVAANEDFAERTAKVTLKAGKKTTVFDVVQKEVTTFETALVYNVGPAAQDISVKVKANVEYNVTVAEGDSWITVVKTKAAPADGEIILHVGANSQLGPRTGHFTISAPSFSQTYEVVQSAEWTPAVKSSGRFVGLRDYFYDEAYQTRNQYIIDMETAEGDIITIVLNLPDEIEDPVAVPVGTYVADATGELSPETFALKGTLGQFYTSFISGGKEFEVADGEITIAVDGENVTITAALVDNIDNTHSYSYEGAFESVKDDFEILVMPGIYGPTYGTTVDTYYTTKANRYNLTIWPTAAPEDGIPALSYVNFTIYGPAGDGTTLPEGTFTYVASIADDENVTYNNGKKIAQPGTFTDWSGNDIPQNPSRIKEGTEATLEIVKNSDGTYKIKFSATLEAYHYVLDEEGNYTYDENWNTIIEVDQTYEYVIEDDSVVVPELKPNGAPNPDVDAVLTMSTIPSYSSLYFGPALGEGRNIFVVQFNYLNQYYSVNAVVTIPESDWVFEENMGRKNYCNTPLPDATYTFMSAEDYSKCMEEGDETESSAYDYKLIPGKYNNASYCSVANSWTGTTGSITGGSFSIAGGIVTFDLDVTLPSGDKVKITGSPALALQAVRNMSAQATRISL